MVRASPKLFVAGLITLAALGCSSSPQQFDVSLKNDTSKRLVIGLAKDGGPDEDLWASPEQIMVGAPRQPEHEWGEPVPPGKTAGFAHPIEGRFDAGSTGYLRVYSDVTSMNDLLSVSRGAYNRLDLTLYPGANNFVVTEENGRLVSTRIDRK